MKSVKARVALAVTFAFGGSLFFASSAAAQGHGCDAISFHNNEATVDCYNQSTTKTVIATLYVDCQPWAPDTKDTASIKPGGMATLSASCFGWGKAVGGSASVS